MIEIDWKDIETSPQEPNKGFLVKVKDDDYPYYGQRSDEGTLWITDGEQEFWICDIDWVATHWARIGDLHD